MLSTPMKVVGAQVWINVNQWSGVTCRYFAEGPGRSARSRRRRRPSVLAAMTRFWCARRLVSGSELESGISPVAVPIASPNADCACPLGYWGLRYGRLGGVATTRR